jgi:hypothetical protein
MNRAEGRIGRPATAVVIVGAAVLLAGALVLVAAMEVLGAPGWTARAWRVER